MLLDLGWRVGITMRRMAMSLKLPADLRLWVAAEARRRQASESEVVRNSLQQARKQSAVTGDVSCADLAGDLIGSLRGPRDLSTNKAYLKKGDSPERHSLTTGRSIFRTVPRLVPKERCSLSCA